MLISGSDWSSSLTYAAQKCNGFGCHPMWVSQETKDLTSLRSSGASICHLWLSQSRQHLIPPPPHGVQQMHSPNVPVPPPPPGVV